MDGTVLDTEPMSFWAWQRALLDNNYPATSEMLMKHVGITSVSAMKLFKSMLGEDFPYWEIRKQVRVYRAEYIEKNGVKTKSGLTELLDFLDENGIKKVIATSTNHKEAAECLKIAGVFDRFDALIGGDEIKEGKPDPEIFLKAQALSGAEKDECIIIEDSDNGIRAAHASGMKCVFIPDMKDCAEELKCMYTHRAESLDKVIEIIRGLQ